MIGYKIYRDAKEWEAYLGEQVKSLRLRLNLSQDELAKRAGIGIVTVSRLESGKGTSLNSLIKALQVLHQESWLEQLAPAVSISPIQVHELGKARQRARAKKLPKQPGKANRAQSKEGLGGSDAL